MYPTRTMEINDDTSNIKTAGSNREDTQVTWLDIR